jgi:urease accessory protein UreH
VDSSRAAVRPVTDGRSAGTIGAHARLELAFASRDGRTILRHAYAEPPLRAGRCFAEGSGVHAMLASSAPGIFGGDCFSQRIVVERSARVRFTSQSALQVHPSVRAEPALLTSAFVVEEDAVLVCDWDPAIPFARSWFEQAIDVTLAARARLVWSDAFMCGRVSGGQPQRGGQATASERWAFDKLSHALNIRRETTLEYAEAYTIEPLGRQARPWVADRASYFGTIVSSGMPLEADTADRLVVELAGVEGVWAAADQLADRLLLVRLMGDDGAAFRRARRLAADWLSHENTK